MSAGDIDADVVWRPDARTAARANVTRLMQRHGLASISELRHWSVEDVGRFWGAVVEDLEIPFTRPYSQVLDVSAGVPWAKWFVGGEINLASACVDEPARRHPSRPAVICEREDGRVSTLTYAELARAVSATAGLLRAHGIGRGDAVGVLLPPCAEAVVAAYAIAKIGALYVPLFSGFGPGAVASRLSDASARIVFTADATLRRGVPRPLKAVLDEALPHCPSVERVLVVDRLGFDVNMRAGRDVAWVDGDGDVGGGEAAATGSEDPFMLIYSSGTTGRPKGAVHVHGGFLVKVAAEVAYQTDVGPDDVACWVSDMGWIMGPWLMVGCHALGATMVLCDGAPDQPGPDRLWSLVERQRLTMLGVSPTLVRALMAQGSDPSGHDLSSLRILAGAGEPWNPEAFRWLIDTCGGKAPLINLSGGTEVAASFLSVHPVESIKVCSLGGPALGMDLDVLDPMGRSIRGGVGELVCRQPWPGMTRGLWHDPGGYLRTYWSTYDDAWRHGDWALVDDDGAWYVLGRSDDVLNIAGKRVGPAEIESLLTAHPAVAEAAAVGVPDDVKGEVVWCFCVAPPAVVPGADVVPALRELIAGELGRPFAPARIIFVDALPHTRSAKIVRRAVRACAVCSDPGDTSSLENPEVLATIRTAVEHAGHPEATSTGPSRDNSPTLRN